MPAVLGHDRGPEGYRKRASTPRIAPRAKWVAVTHNILSSSWDAW
jgi:hypothetical protein